MEQKLVVALVETGDERESHLSLYAFHWDSGLDAVDDI
jgi:hypothetical protein